MNNKKRKNKNSNTKNFFVAKIILLFYYFTYGGSHTNPSTVCTSSSFPCGSGAKENDILTQDCNADEQILILCFSCDAKPILEILEIFEGVEILEIDVVQIAFSIR